VKAAGVPSDLSFWSIEYCVLAASILVSAGSLVSALILSGYGFDLTDESFYVLWISKPWLYDASLSQFGFIYHPLYRLVGGDIILLRQANVLVFFALAFIVGMVLFRQLLPEDPTTSESSEVARKWTIAGLSFAFASVSLLGFLPLHSTPSYNTLGGQALLLAAIGILLAKRDMSWGSIAGWILLGIAGWLCFMAKPSSAAALGVAVAAYLLSTRKIEIRLFLLAVGVAVLLLFISALVIDGSITSFTWRYLRALKLYKQLTIGTPRQSTFLFGPLGLTREDAILYSGILVFLVTSVTWLRMQRSSCLIFITNILACGLCAAIVIEIIDFSSFYRSLGAETINNKSFGTKSIVVVLIGSMAAYLLLFSAKRAPKLTRGEASCVLLFSVFPYIYALGTSVSYWFLGPMAGIFWVVAAILILAPARPGQNSWGIFLPIIVASQLIVTTAASLASNFPYRQPQALRSSQAVLPMGEAGSPLRLSRESADYISTMRRLAQMGGLKPSDPLLDLTGQSPGIAVALGATAIGQPWLLGGYPGSRSYAEMALDRASCHDIAAAWIVAGPLGRRALPADLLSRYSIDISRDYMSVGTVSARDPDTRKRYEQILYKPARSLEEGMQACESVRNRLNP